MIARLLALALCLPAAAAPPSSALDKVRGWPIYDARADGETDLGDLCRIARLPCGVAALMLLRESGWPAPGNAGLASLTGDTEDARYARVQVIVYKGATVRRVLDAIARGDGRMLWLAESDGKTCAGFRFLNWRAPQPIEASSVLVSVSGTGKIP